MFFPEFVAALIVAALVVGLFAVVLRRPGPWAGVGWFFLVVFLGAWAVGVWTAPVGPAVVGIAWLPFVIGALLLALLVTAVTDWQTRDLRSSRSRQGSSATADEALALGAFFWIFVTLTILFILIGIAATP